MEAGFSSLIGQLLNGLAGASSLFLVAAGLSLIFGVTRIVNFAHGSFYMLGLYVAYTLVNSQAWFTPRAPTISRSCVAARTSVPKRVRVSSSHTSANTTGPTTIKNKS